MKSISKLDVEIEGVKTEVLIQSFIDRVLLLVTQLGKVGCLVSVVEALPYNARSSQRFYKTMFSWT